MKIQSKIETQSHEFELDKRNRKKVIEGCKNGVVERLLLKYRYSNNLKLIDKAFRVDKKTNEFK